MPMNELTQLQFLVLTKIGAVERSGRDVREMMEQEGYRKSLPAFYQLMSRMEDAGLVSGANYKIDIDGQPAVERRYKVTGAGRNAANDTRRFYLDHGKGWLAGSGGRA
jgi:DNA-binding PadR family transcriptional regulator